MHSSKIFVAILLVGIMLVLSLTACEDTKPNNTENTVEGTTLAEETKVFNNESGNNNLENNNHVQNPGGQPIIQVESTTESTEESTEVESATEKAEVSATQGLVFTVNEGNTAYSVTDYVGSNTEIVIPALYNGLPVTSIGNNAFSHSNLTSITIPSSIVSIGSGAFYNCSSLANIAIPNNVTNIGFGAFWDCTGLVSITLPFVGATKDGTFNTNFGYIFGSSYYNEVVPTSLKIVVITGGTVIGDDAFYDCSNLTEIIIPDSITSIGHGAFLGCNNLTSITIPFIETATYDTSNNTYLGYLFGSSSDSYSNIPTSLKTVIITSGNSIGKKAFANCDNLINVTICNGVTVIGDDAFYDCDNLTSVAISDSITHIGEDAFRGCNNLNAVHIADLAAWCNIKFDNTTANPLYYAQNFYLNHTLITNLIIPEGVTNITNEAFRRCPNVTSVLIPDSVTHIGYWAFMDCRELNKVIFENPNNWWYSNKTPATNGTAISAVDLLDPSTAATYLTSTYKSYYWNRS